MTNSSNELNNKLRHTLGWCLYTLPEEECQHLPANEDDEQTISELSALLAEQVRLGKINGAHEFSSFVNEQCQHCHIASPHIDDWEAQLKDSTKEDK